MHRGTTVLTVAWRRRFLLCLVLPIQNPAPKFSQRMESPPNMFPAARAHLQVACLVADRLPQTPVEECRAESSRVEASAVLPSD
jgi:hypothetical protein